VDDCFGCFRVCGIDAGPEFVREEQIATGGTGAAPAGDAARTRPVRPPAGAGPAKADPLAGEIKAFESEAIYFDYDKSDLKPAARATLEKKAAWLRSNPQFKLKVEGHCDERGTVEYNLALGERRAKSAVKYLKRLGISGDRMTTVSYGEEKPRIRVTMKRPGPRTEG